MHTSVTYLPDSWTAGADRCRWGRCRSWASRRRTRSRRRWPVGRRGSRRRPSASIAGARPPFGRGRRSGSAGWWTTTSRGKCGDLGRPGREPIAPCSCRADCDFVVDQREKVPRSAAADADDADDHRSTASQFSPNLVSIITDHFSGPRRAIRPLCVCVPTNFRTKWPSAIDIWHDGLPCLVYVKFKGQGHISQVTVTRRKVNFSASDAFDGLKSEWCLGKPVSTYCNQTELSLYTLRDGKWVVGL